MSATEELEAIEKRYARRTRTYDPLSPWMCETLQERERALIRCFRCIGLTQLAACRLLEIGCGGGSNLQQFLRLGFRPENLTGVELIADRAAAAQHFLPASVHILVGNGAATGLPDAEFDVVFQSLVFTSVLHDHLRRDLAVEMWRLTRPGGGVLWYDFVFDNPFNPDVRKVSLREVRRLFPSGNVRTWRLTLAPPLARTVTRIHPRLYGLFNAIPFLRTHILCWIPKKP